MKIKHVAFFVLPSSDIQKSKAFYEDLIGLTPLETTFGDDWIEYDIEGTTLVLTSRQFPNAMRGKLTAGISFEVDDVDAWFKKCESAGIEILMPPMELPSCYSTLLADPDGNVIAFHKIH